MQRKRYIHLFAKRNEQTKRKEMSILHTMTINQVREQYDKSERAFQIAWPKMGNKQYAKNREATEQEIARIAAYYGSPRNAKGRIVKKGKKEKPVLAAKVIGVAEKSDDRFVMFWVPISITALSICLTVTGLFVFANWAGGMLGGMFALFLFTAVWVARDRMKGATSEKALETVLYLEIGAACLHCFTFWRLLPEFEYQYMPGKIILCGALAAFSAYLSYSAVLTVRNYNAEIEDNGQN